MRPASIVQFERLYFAAAAMGIVGQLLSWDAVMAAARAQPAIATMGPGFVAGGLVVMDAVILALGYFTARRRRAAAKWGVSAWFVLSSVMLALGVFRSGLHLDLVSVASWASYGLLLWSVSYLFKPDAEAWLSARDASPE